jgi:hypothetical protein
MEADSKIGGENFTGANPFAPGVRETYQMTKGAFFPVSLASESGRAAFIPISRGELFFDRFTFPATAPTALSTTTWDNYTIGALQCAMQLDVVEVDPITKDPTKLQFSYYLVNGQRVISPLEIELPFPAGNKPLPAEYEGLIDGVEPLPGKAVDLAYVVGGNVTYIPAISGPIEVAKVFDGLSGGQAYWRPRCPFGIKKNGVQTGIAVNAECIPEYLAAIDPNAAPVGPGGTMAPHFNNSLVVNVDYTSHIGPSYPIKPNIPCTDADYGVVLDECGNLTPFTSGFSIVTNMRLFVAENFNTTTTAAGNYPPCSIFSPERRVGFMKDALAVQLKGQIGSLSKGDKFYKTDVPETVRPLDSRTKSGKALTADQITVDLSQIQTPAELPPITMMNWLVLLEEVR